MEHLFANHYKTKSEPLREQRVQNPTVKPEIFLQRWWKQRGKSLPSDDIDDYSLKLIAPILIIAIRHLVNLSILSGVFAFDWKTQIILPHHKKLDRDLLDNYRPVSTIVEMGKLTELVVHEQFMGHFMEHGLFHPDHHGSLPNHDTTTSLLQVNSFMIKSAEKKQIAGSLFIDQTSAFDLVDHDVLLKKLAEYSFSPTTLKWFSSYLEGRTFQVQIESRRSDPVNLGPYGVPQGSVLGSMLFVVSENDLPAASPQEEDEQAVVYVDDDTEQAADTDPMVMLEKLQCRADNTVSWLKDNMMIVAPGKTKLIVTATPEMRAARLNGVDLSVVVDGVRVYATESEKLLGLMLDQDLTWSTHLWGESWRAENNQKGVIPSLIQRLGLIKHLGRVTSHNKMRNFVPGLFMSKLIYGLAVTSSVWGLSTYAEREHNKISCTKQDVLKLQSLQRQAAVLVCPQQPDPMMPTREILRMVDWLSVHQLASYHILLLVLRVVTTGKPKYLAAGIMTAPSSRTQQSKLVVPRCRLNIALEGFFNQGTRLYNKLPEDITQETSKPILKRKLKTWVMANIEVKPGDGLDPLS